MTPNFRPEVAFDLADAASWYDSQNVGLGDEFMGEYRITLAKVIDNPHQRPVIRSGLRWWKLGRFPYMIWYRLSDTQLVIAGVLHSRRDRTILDDRG